MIILPRNRGELVVPKTEHDPHGEFSANAQYKAVTRQRDKKRRRNEKRLKDAVAGGWHFARKA